LISLLFAGAITSLKNQVVYTIPNTIIPIPLVSVALSIVLIAIIAYAIIFSKREIKDITADIAEEGPISENKSEK